MRFWSKHLAPLEGLSQVVERRGRRFVAGRGVPSEPSYTGIEHSSSITAAASISDEGLAPAALTPITYKGLGVRGSGGLAVGNS